jgi:2-octaprenyl-6-methoxyphenol hydroxylase
LSAGGDSEVDVAIVGGGLVGASLAAALSGLPLKVALIEAAAPPRSEPAWDERCIALNDTSQRIFARLGLWPELAADAAAIVATHISERGRFGTARFAAQDAGVEALGYNVPLRSIGAALWQRLQQSATQLHCPAQVESLTIDSSAATLHIAPAAAGAQGSAPKRQPATLDPAAAPARSSLAATAAPRRIRARLVVAADGASSAVRGQLGIAAQTRDYGQHAIVSAVRTSRPHHGVAYERFTPDGPLALIPKPDDASSLVWTVPAARVAELLALADDAYLALAAETFGTRLGRFLQLGRRWSYPLARVVTAEPVAQRVVFVGNAAQSLHPVAAQGFNLGLRDVNALAELLGAGGDPGDPGRLAAYAGRRARDRQRISTTTDLMVRSFSNRIPGLAQLRHWGLVAVDLLPGLREAVMDQHLGRLDLPRPS